MDAGTAEIAQHTRTHHCGRDEARSVREEGGVLIHRDWAKGGGVSKGNFWLRGAQESNIAGMTPCRFKIRHAKGRKSITTEIGSQDRKQLFEFLDRDELPVAFNPALVPNQKPKQVTSPTYGLIIETPWNE